MPHGSELIICVMQKRSSRLTLVPAEGSIATISKKKGDTVAEDDVLFQIETDKVTIDVRAPQSGTLESILVFCRPIVAPAASLC